MYDEVGLWIFLCLYILCRWYSKVEHTERHNCPYHDHKVTGAPGFISL